MKETQKTFNKPAHVEFILTQFTNQQIDRILETSSNWRDIKERKVAEYAQRMRSGQWDSGNGECIAFTPDGKCVNGQHRLAAARIVQSEQKEEKRIWFWCAYNVTHTAVETMDQGQNRKVVEFLRHDKIANAEEVAAIAAAAARVEMGGENTSLYLILGAPVPPSNAQVLDVYRRNAAGIDYWSAITSRFRSYPFPRASLLGQLLYQFSRQDADAAKMFAEKLLVGESMSKYDPAFVLREMLLAEKSAKRSKDRTEFAALVVKAWVAWMESREIRNLKFTQVGPTAERFPDHRYAV